MDVQGIAKHACRYAALRRRKRDLHSPPIRHSGALVSVGYQVNPVMLSRQGLKDLYMTLDTSW